MVAFWPKQKLFSRSTSTKTFYAPPTAVIFTVKFWIPDFFGFPDSLRTGGGAQRFLDFLDLRTGGGVQRFVLLIYSIYDRCEMNYEVLLRVNTRYILCKVIVKLWQNKKGFRAETELKSSEMYWNSEAPRSGWPWIIFNIRIWQKQKGICHLVLVHILPRPRFLRFWILILNKQTKAKKLAVPESRL